MREEEEGGIDTSGTAACKGLGTFIILDHIIRAARAGLPYVYFGYWVEGSERMRYKASFRPMERLGRDGWREFDFGPLLHERRAIQFPIDSERRMGLGKI